MSDQFKISDTILQILGAICDPASLKQAIISLTNQTQTAINTLATQPQAPSGAAGGDLSGVYPNPTVAKVSATLSSYNGVSTVSNGIAAEYAAMDAVAQSANINSATLYAVPANKSGFYRATCYAVVTQAATTSSTLPNVGVGWTDNDSNTPLVANTVTPTNTANALGAFGGGSQVFYAKAGTNITWQTSGYASSGVTSMQYAVHIKLEYLG